MRGTGESAPNTVKRTQPNHPQKPINTNNMPIIRLFVNTNNNNMPIIRLFVNTNNMPMIWLFVNETTRP